jgi:hypothetical protein
MPGTTKPGRDQAWNNTTLKRALFVNEQKILAAGTRLPFLLVLLDPPLCAEIYCTVSYTAQRKKKLTFGNFLRNRADGFFRKIS